MPALFSLQAARPTTRAARLSADDAVRCRLPHSVEDTNSSLLHRVRDVTDAPSWSEFVRRYEPLLLSYVRGRGLQEHDARDVVQEVFARLHRALPSFQLNRERGRFRTWLYQVASIALTRLGPRPQSPGPRRAGLRDTPADHANRRAVRGRFLECRASPGAGACVDSGADVFATENVGRFEQRILRGRLLAPWWRRSWV